MSVIEGRESTVQGKCLGHAGRSRGHLVMRRRKPEDKGVVDSSRGAIHRALPVNGARGGCKVHSLPAHTWQSCLEGPFSSYSAARLSLKGPGPLAGKESINWLRGSPGLTEAISLAGCHRIKKQAKAATRQKLILPPTPRAEEGS